jgi:hypothetical protein
MIPMPSRVRLFLGKKIVSIKNSLDLLFLNSSLQKDSKKVYITPHISQMTTLILRVDQFLDYYIAAE